MARISRRELFGAGAFAAACSRPEAQAPQDPHLLNDIHAQLSATRVREVARPSTVEELRHLLERAERGDLSLSVSGGRHSMGGQPFGNDTVHIDSRGLNRVLDFDPQTGRVVAEAGIQWPELVQALLDRQEGRDGPGWGIAQKQTGADRMTLGGSLSANAHGRGLTLQPMVGDVRSITLLTADGSLRTASRTEEPELFSLAAGGYGLFGLLYSVELQLVPRQMLRRRVEILEIDSIPHAIEERIEAGFLYGDFQFAIDAASPNFLRKGVFSCYEPAKPDAPAPEKARRLRRRQWTELLYYAHEEPSRAYDLYVKYYLSTDGQSYWSDLQQLSLYMDDYHGALDGRLPGDGPGTEMITELYVPRNRLVEFMGSAAEELRRREAQVVYGTVRWIERDDVSFLRWAREPWACIVLNLHVDHTEAGLSDAAEAFRALIRLALRFGGSYFLTYHRWAEPEELLAAYPQFPEFLEKKRERDPHERFQSDWYRHYRGLLAGASTAVS